MLSTTLGVGMKLVDIHKEPVCVACGSECGEELECDLSGGFAFEFDGDHTTDEVKYMTVVMECGSCKTE